MDDLGFDFLPNERRHFVHKRIGRAVKGFVTSGFNPLSAVASFIAPAPQVPVRRPAPRSTVARASQRGAAQKEAGRQVKLRSMVPGVVNGQPFGDRGVQRLAGGTCDGVVWVKTDVGCVNVVTGATRPFDNGDVTTATEITSGVGGAVMGRFGAGLTPGSRIIDRAVCLRGMVLGEDGICYNRSQIKNSERMWPRGRRPLLTGGDMRAISIASRAASRLTRTAVRLQEIGLIKKPVARKPRKSKHS